MELPVPLAVALQTAFNRYLQMDPDASQSIARLSGKIVELQISGIGISVFLLFHCDRVEVLEMFDAQPDVTIVGAPFSMMAVISGRASVFDGSVKIIGDVDIAQKFSRTLDSLEVDWEEQLSILTGDTVAHQLGRLVRGFGAWTSRTHSAMRANTSDYLRDETEHLPHQWEVDEFIQGVDDLRDAVERLEARVLAYRMRADDSAVVAPEQDR